MEQIKAVALKTIREALESWAFDDAPGFLTFTDGVLTVVDNLEKCPGYDFISCTKIIKENE